MVRAICNARSGRVNFGRKSCTLPFKGPHLVLSTPKLLTKIDLANEHAQYLNLASFNPLLHPKFFVK